jgi:hypothetical protein
MRALVWNSLLTAQMNTLYWQHLASRYCVREKWTKILLAVMSSGVVAGWTFWAAHDAVWKILSGLAAIVAVALPILDFSGQVQKLTKLTSKCAQLRMGYELLWAQINSMSSQSLEAAIEKLSQQAIEISDLQVVFSDDRGLLMQSQNEVLSSRGLPMITN